MGRRIERSSRGSGSESYTYDGQDTVLDQNSNGSQTAYANGPGLDNKLSQVRDGDHGYFLQNHLGSTVALTDPSGHDPSTPNYDSFGRPTSGANTRFTYTGREADADTGLMYYRARWYDPQLGRFVSEDPIGFAGGDINLYGYAGNNPIEYNDPQGTEHADRDRPGDFYPGMREPYRPNASGPATSANSQIQCSCSGNPVEVFFWQPTDNDIHGLAGHVSYNIDGYMYNWQGGGWAKPVEATDYIRANVQYRSANSYVLDFGPEGNKAFASGIANAYVGQEPMFGFPNWPYNLVSNNCGSAVGRSAEGMGMPYDWHVSPWGQEMYVNNNLGPYIIQRTHYAQEGRGRGPLDSIRNFFESLAGSIESLYGVPH